MSVVFPQEVYSPNHVSNLMQEIEVRIGALQDIAAQKKVSTVTRVIMAPSPLLTILLELNKVDANSTVSLEALLIDLKAAREVAPVVSLTLAGWPNVAVRQQLVKWFRSEIHPSILLKFVVVADICGGIVVQTQNRRFDFSYRELLLENRHKIAEYTYHAG